MMDRSIFLVQTNAKPGQEAQFNEWYTYHHLPEILALPGFVAAQRFELSGVRRDSDVVLYPYRYLAVYDLDQPVHDANRTLTELSKSASPLSTTPAMAHQRTGEFFTAISDRIVSRG